jgi:hypothetical protein
MSTPFWTTIGIGSIIAAVLGWLGIKSVMIANHLQPWINGLTRGGALQRAGT